MLIPYDRFEIRLVKQRYLKQESATCPLTFNGDRCKCQPGTVHDSKTPPTQSEAVLDDWISASCHTFDLCYDQRLFYPFAFSISEATETPPRGRTVFPDMSGAAALRIFLGRGSTGQSAPHRLRWG